MASCKVGGDNETNENTRSDDCAISDSLLGLGKLTPTVTQTTSVLQSRPVSAAVSGSLQQSMSCTVTPASGIGQ